MPETEKVRGSHPTRTFFFKRETFSSYMSAYLLSVRSSRLKIVFFCCAQFSLILLLVFDLLLEKNSSAQIFSACFNRLYDLILSRLNGNPILTPPSARLKFVVCLRIVLLKFHFSF